MYNDTIESAIRAASVLHHEQIRKGRIPYPYITHLMAVASILRDHTDDSDVVAAGILHDTLEDTDYTVEDMRRDFGDRITDMVCGVSECLSVQEGEAHSWEARKEVYLAQLSKAPEESLMISAADKIHNFSCVVEEYSSDPARFLQDFGDNIERRMAAYTKVANLINEKCTSDIVDRFNAAFRDYKDLLANVAEYRDKAWQRALKA